MTTSPGPTPRIARTADRGNIVFKISEGRVPDMGYHLERGGTEGQLAIVAAALRYAAENPVEAQALAKAIEGKVGREIIGCYAFSASHVPRDNGSGVEVDVALTFHP